MHTDAISGNETVYARPRDSYLQLAALAYLPYSISNNYIMSLRAVEQVKISAAIYGVSFFVNVFFNYGFIFGKFGFPALGVRGAAVGTVLARCTELLLALLYLTKNCCPIIFATAYLWLATSCFGVLALLLSVQF